LGPAPGTASGARPAPGAAGARPAPDLPGGARPMPRTPALGEIPDFELRVPEHGPTSLEGSRKFYEAWMDRCLACRGSTRPAACSCRRRHRSKLRCQEVVRCREGRLNEWLSRREEGIRSALELEVAILRDKSHECTLVYNEGLLAFEEVKGLYDRAKEDRKVQHKAHKAAVAELRARLEAAEEAAEKAAEEDQFEEVEAPLPTRAVGAGRGRGRPRPAEAATAGAGKRRPKQADSAALLPPQAKPRSDSFDPGGASPGGAPHEAVPGADSPRSAAGEASPDVAPFVEYVGAPVGKGMKVPSGLWGISTTDVMTRGRTRQI